MKIRVSIIVALICGLSLAGGGVAGGMMQQSPLRVALVGFSGAATAERASDDQLPAALQAALARSAQVALIDPAQIKPAVAGVGYQGAINMTREEARRLGAAIGCD